MIDPYTVIDPIKYPLTVVVAGGVCYAIGLAIGYYWRWRESKKLK